MKLAMAVVLIAVVFSEAAFAGRPVGPKKKKTYVVIEFSNDEKRAVSSANEQVASASQANLKRKQAILDEPIEIKEN